LKKISVLLGIFVLAGLAYAWEGTTTTTTATTTTIPCYQESTNASSIIDGKCSLSYSGSYATGGLKTPAYAWDGNWGTQTTGSYLLSAYIKPTGALNTSKIEVELYYGGTSIRNNYSIPIDCWLYDSGSIQFLIYACGMFPNDCMNESDNTAGIMCRNGINLTAPYNGNWTYIYHNDSGLDAMRLSEEGMHWNISSNLSMTNFSVSNTSVERDAIVTFYANCYSNWTSNVIIEVSDTAGHGTSYPATLVSGTLYSVSVALNSVGNWSFSAAYANDSSGSSILYDNISINVTVSAPTVIIIGPGGGGGGGSSTVLEKLNLSINCAQTEGIHLYLGGGITCVISNTGDKNSQVSLFLEGTNVDVAGNQKNTKDFILMMPKEGAITLVPNSNLSITIVENLPLEVNPTTEYNLKLFIIGSKDSYTIPISLRLSESNNVDLFIWLNLPWWKGIVSISGNEQVVSIPNYVIVTAIFSVIIVLLPKILKKKN
jgi:hypothetical protein